MIFTVLIVYVHWLRHVKRKWAKCSQMFAKMMCMDPMNLFQCLGLLTNVRIPLFSNQNTTQPYFRAWWWFSTFGVINLRRRRRQKGGNVRMDYQLYLLWSWTLRETQWHKPWWLEPTMSTWTHHQLSSNLPAISHKLTWESHSVSGVHSTDFYQCPCQAWICTRNLELYRSAVWTWFRYVASGHVQKH